MLLLRPLMPATGPQFSSLFQAGVRWNGYVALGVIAGLQGDEGVALSAVGFAVLVPINNVMSVLVLSRYAGTKPAPFKQVVRSVATNPLIISTVLAIILVSLNVRVSEPVGDTLNLLGDATVALGLICVGAALDFSSMRATPSPLAIGTTLRLVVMPAVAAGMCFAIGLSDRTFEVAMVCVAAPVATSAYILARQLGGDSTLMANIITLTTLLSLLTIPADAAAGAAADLGRRRLFQALHQFLPHLPRLEAGMQARQPVRIDGAVRPAEIARHRQDFAGEDVDGVLDLLRRSKDQLPAAMLDHPDGPALAWRCFRHGRVEDGRLPVWGIDALVHPGCQG